MPGIRFGHALIETRPGWDVPLLTCDSDSETGALRDGKGRNVLTRRQVGDGPDPGSRTSPISGFVKD